MSILIDWLSLSDYGRLDSAVCNKKSRVELQLLIYASPHAFATELSDYRHPKASWLIAHGVRCRNVSLWRDLLLDPFLREKFFIHSGRALQSLDLKLSSLLTDESNGVVFCSLRGVLSGLTNYCPSLKEINIEMSSDKYQLSDLDFLSVHAFISEHPSLQGLSLLTIVNLPSTLVGLALCKLEHVTLLSCTITEDALQTMHLQHTANFTCTNTPLPSSLCRYVTDVSLGTPVNTSVKTIEPLIPSYINLSYAALNSYQIRIDSHVAQLIGQHWRHLAYLYAMQVNEEIVLELIKLLPALQVLDAAGEKEVEKPKQTYGRAAQAHNKKDLCSTSQLYALSMYCDRTTILEEILQLCPVLTTLSLYQPPRTKGIAMTFVPVEKSLHLLQNTNICALYLSEYIQLSDANLAALRHAKLHTLSITESGWYLQDKAMLHLLPTLPYLHTLEFSYCSRLTYNLVLKVPPLCPKLRSFTYIKPQNRCCGDNSNSSHILDKVLPQIFPHVREFYINC